jgi:tetratricopeptide (TPR) repeat protein
MEARKHLEGSASLFERLGMLAPLAIARVNLSEVYHDTGVLKKALAIAERTIGQAREVNHPHGIALGLAHRAIILSEFGRHEEATQNAFEALRIVRSLGTTEDEMFALATLVRVRMMAHQWSKALHHLDELLPRLEEVDPEGIEPQVHAWQARVLAELGRTEEATEVLARTAIADDAWPHIRVRTGLAIAQAHISLGQRAQAEAILLDTLQLAEANGYRFHQLQAQHELVQVTDDEAERTRHERVAQALARSLSAGLAAEDSRGFLARHWGEAA